MNPLTPVEEDGGERAANSATERIPPGVHFMSTRSACSVWAVRSQE